MVSNIRLHSSAFSHHMLQPSAPSTEVESRSSRFMIWVASHSTIPSKIPMRQPLYGVAPGVQVPPLKNGVMYAMMNPSPLRMAQVMTMRLSQARLSSTVRPFLEKFMSRSATEAQTTAVMVEMETIWV